MVKRVFVPNIDISEDNDSIICAMLPYVERMADQYSQWANIPGEYEDLKSEGLLKLVQFVKSRKKDEKFLFSLRISIWNAFFDYVRRIEKFTGPHLERLGNMDKLIFAHDLGAADRIRDCCETPEEKVIIDLLLQGQSLKGISKYTGYLQKEIRKIAVDVATRAKREHRKAIAPFRFDTRSYRGSKQIKRSSRIRRRKD